MEFWGVEVKAGEPLKVVPEQGKLIHISQAALGDVKGKGKGFIPLRVKIEGKELVLGSLSADNIPQVNFDLVFHTEFELSHGCKNGSVHFCGFLDDEVLPEEHDDFPYDSESDSEGESQDSDEELPVNNDVGNGKLKPSTNDDDDDDDKDSEDEETPKEINHGKKILPVPSKKAKADTRSKGGHDNCGCGHAHAPAATKRSKSAGKTSPGLAHKSKKAKHA